MTVKWFYIILIERGKISYVYMEVNKVFVGRCQNIKICTKLKKHNQPNQPHHHTNPPKKHPHEEICKIKRGGKNVCLELLYAMMKRFLEMT